MFFSPSDPPEKPLGSSLAWVPYLKAGPQLPPVGLRDPGLWRGKGCQDPPSEACPRPHSPTPRTAWS